MPITMLIMQRLVSEPDYDHPGCVMRNNKWVFNPDAIPYATRNIHREEQAAAAESIYYAPTCTT
jgi:hypothetical protein